MPSMFSDSTVLNIINNEYTYHWLTLRGLSAYMTTH